MKLMNWVTLYRIILLIGILILLTSLALEPLPFLITASTGAAITIFAFIELKLIKKHTLQPLSAPPIASSSPANFIPSLPFHQRTPSTSFSRMSFFQKLFPQKTQKTMSSPSPKQKRTDIAVFKTSGIDRKVELLHAYILKSLAGHYPKEKIKEAALKANWPEDLFTETLDIIINKRVRGKLIILGTIFLLSIVLSTILITQDIFLVPYWISSLKYASLSFYIGASLIFFVVIVLFIIKLKQTLKKKKITYKIEETQHVADIKEAVKGATSQYETELDRLYAILIEKGRLTITEIAEGFGISKKEAEEWSKILKEQDLVDIHYPAVGDPEVIWKPSKSTKSL